MSPVFNLLPARYAERLAERRRIGATVVALLVLLLLLGMVSMAQGRRLEEARSQLEVEQEQTGVLEARRAELAPFGELAEGIAVREGLLTAAMQTEISWARVLAGLSAAFPPDASLVAFSAESTLATFAGELPVVGEEGSPIGSTTYSGYSVAGFDPGLADTLRQLAMVPGLAEPTLQEGAADEVGGMPVTTFDGATFVDGASLSGRYAEGLPPEGSR